MANIILAFRRSIDDSGLTQNQAMVVAFLIMAALLLAGIILLRTIDYFRERVKMFLPLFDSKLDAYRGIGGYCVLPFIACGIGMFIFGLNCGIQLFVLISVIVLIWDRIAIEEQGRLAANVCAEIAEAIRSRIALDVYFDTIVKEHYPILGLVSVGKRLREGAILSEALGESGVFTQSAILTIRAGEAGGGASLVKILEDLSTSLNNENRSAARLLTATLIPFLGWSTAFVLAWGISSYWFVRFMEILKIFGPLNGSYALVTMYSQCAGIAALITLGSFLIVFSYEGLFRSGRLFNCVQRILYALPVLGLRRQHRDLSRMCHAMSSMVQSDVALWAAFRLVGKDEIAGMYAPTLRQLADRLEKGATFQEALRSSNLPESVTCLLIAGAAGGTLAEAFSAAAEWHDSRALKLDHALSTIIPCIMIPLAGLIVGVAYGSVFWVLMEIRESIMIHAGQVH